MRRIQLGIAGTGRVAERFARMLLAEEGVDISSVYNPRRESAAAFAGRFGAGAFTDDLEVFAGQAEAFYVAAPHGAHEPIVRFLLERGRHVLCEKPLCFSRETAAELFRLASEKGAVLMEAVKTAYCPGFAALLGMARSGKIGRVRDVEACFTRLTPTNLREMRDRDFGGSFTEFGTYALLPIVKLMGTEYREVHFQQLPGVTGVDIYAKAVFDYGDGGMALAKTGLGVKSEGQLVIAGTKGYILAPSPWWLTRRFQVRYEDPGRIEEYGYPYEGSGFQYEFRAFAQKIRGGEDEAGKPQAGAAEAVGSKDEAVPGFPGEPAGAAQTGVTPAESAAIAGILGRFLEERRENAGVPVPGTSGNRKLRIWAHRGLSAAWPENTLEAFRAAAELPGLTGIEFDVQRTKDGRLVVIHDEDIKRTTDGAGLVKDFAWEELAKKKISLPDGGTARIPLLEEVLALLTPYCRERGLLLNIELKTGNVRYEGIEAETVGMVRRFALEPYVVYSSFLPESVGLVKKLDPAAKTGILAASMEDCIRLARQWKADAVHPWIGGLDARLPEDMAGMPVRAWNGEETLYGDGGKGRKVDLREYGVTDLFVNEAGDI